MATYFISDIHLHADADKNSRLLLEFLQTTGFSADAIYILGDLFAVWFGDDLHLNDPYVQDLCMALRNLTNNKVPVYIMHGNRDFLLAHQFCAESGCKLLPDPYVIELYGKKILLTHGDLLCTNDLSYQRFRSIVQHPWIKKIFANLPKKLRFKIGQLVKKKSGKSSQKRYIDNPEIFEVDPNTVQAWLAKHQVQHIIHGHTHQAAIHQIGSAKRIVLGDWNDFDAKILEYTPEQASLQNLLGR